MKYLEFMENLKQDKDFQNVLQFITNLKGKKIYYFSHDDPDGITSAAIMAELFEYLGYEYKLFFPSNFALRKEDIPDNNYDAILITDKGTLKEYDTFYDENKPFLTIDHHFTPGVPEKVMYYNPSLKPNSYCSASFIVHNIATALGFRSDYTDFYAMVGMKGDWVIDPAIDMIAPYVQSFYDDFESKFPNLVEKKKGFEPTMFEAGQKEVSTLLSVYSHDLHGISGGAFQFFYNDRDEKLKDIFHPQFSYELLRGIEKKSIDLKSVKDVDELLAIPGYEEIAKLMLKFYKEDWDKGINLLNTAVELKTVKATRIFLYMGKEMNLMPMLGSVTLFDLANGEDAIFIMAAKIDYGIHFSVRSTGGNIHSGKLCGNLAEEAKNTVNDENKKFISGGGHPKAAECNIKIKDYPYDDALKMFLNMFNEIKTDFDQEKFGV
ncbi:DHH family phosphoesterase [bacterium]|nr:DHH family phosphoesterase [bacterium]